MSKYSKGRIRMDLWVIVGVALIVGEILAWFVYSGLGIGRIGGCADGSFRLHRLAVFGVCSSFYRADCRVAKNFCQLLLAQ